MNLLIGGAYAVSAGLIVYAIERGYVTPREGFRYLFAWAVLGAILAVLAVILHRREK